MPEPMPQWMQQMIGNPVIPKQEQANVYSIPYRKGYDPNFVPYSQRKFKNVVEKQAEYNRFIKDYGSEVKGRQTYLEALDTPVKAYSDDDAIRGDVPADLKQNTTLREVIYNSGKYKNPSLLYSSIMDEGMDTEMQKHLSDASKNKNWEPGTSGRFSIWQGTGIGDPVLEYENNPSFKPVSKELLEMLSSKNMPVVTNLYDLVDLKNAAIERRQKLVDKAASELGVKLSDKARDYFILVGYNAGENAIKGKIKNIKDKGLLENDKFMTDKSLYAPKDQYRGDSHAYAIRRLKAKDMIEGEEFGNKKKKLVMEFKEYIKEKNKGAK